ncbi:hypothetical protein C0Q58_14335 [Streptomyces albidoflavus]|nr:hypothetical protein C0Q58_14335 [Streptomyces albidoflavus]
MYLDGMTDTSDAPEPRVLSPRDEARVAFAMRAQRVSALALDLLPVDPTAPHGERLRRVLKLKDEMDSLLERAVIAEREGGATWTQLAEAAGISKQAAHERWAGAVSAWATNGRTALPHDSFTTTLDAARTLDAVYAGGVRDNRSLDAVSSGLDAVRFPGAVAAEAARRERAAGLHARIEPLGKQVSALLEQRRLLANAGAQPQARAEVQFRLAAVYEERGALHEELTAAEPELGDEHRVNAETDRAYASSNREHAELLADRAKDEAAKGSA